MWYKKTTEIQIRFSSYCEITQIMKISTNANEENGTRLAIGKYFKLVYQNSFVSSHMKKANNGVSRLYTCAIVSNENSKYTLI